MALKEKLSDIAKKIQALKDDLKAQINQLPQNPRLKPVGQSGTCFTLKLSQLGPGAILCPTYHDFKSQYRALEELVQRGSPDNLLSRLNQALESGVVQAHLGESCKRKFKLHPEVIEHVRKLL